MPVEAKSKTAIIVVGTNAGNESASTTQNNIYQLAESLIAHSYKQIVFVPANPQVNGGRQTKIVENAYKAFSTRYSEGVYIRPETLSWLGGDKDHLTKSSVQSIYDKYPGSLVIGDSNANRFQEYGIAPKPLVFGYDSQTSGTVYKNIEKLRLAPDQLPLPADDAVDLAAKNDTTGSANDTQNNNDNAALDPNNGEVLADGEGNDISQAASETTSGDSGNENTGDNGDGTAQAPTGGSGIHTISEVE